MSKYPGTSPKRTSFIVNNKKISSELLFRALAARRNEWAVVSLADHRFIILEA